jgi:hypothetical protein
VFLMKYCSYIATRVSEIHKDKSVGERLGLATISVSRVFAEVSLRNKNFAEFCSMGSYHENVQSYLLGLIGKGIEEYAGDWSECLAACFSDVEPEAVQPFMTKTGIPNVFSFFHLIFQSLRQDFVCPSLHIPD